MDRLARSCRRCAARGSHATAVPMSLLGAEPAPNAFRYSGIPGHVESYFWRANDPAAPRALWLKATVLAPLDGPAVAESWLIWFDGVRNRKFAAKLTWPIGSARFPTGAADEIQLGASGRCP